jgi:hypothetical protein
LGEPQIRDLPSIALQAYFCTSSKYDDSSTLPPSA